MRGGEAWLTILCLAATETEKTFVWQQQQQQTHRKISGHTAAAAAVCVLNLSPSIKSPYAVCKQLSLVCHSYRYSVDFALVLLHKKQTWGTLWSVKKNYSLFSNSNMKGWKRYLAQAKGLSIVQILTQSFDAIRFYQVLNLAHTYKSSQGFLSFFFTAAAGAVY